MNNDDDKLHMDFDHEIKQVMHKFIEKSLENHAIQYKDVLAFGTILSLNAIFLILNFDKSELDSCAIFKQYFSESIDRVRKRLKEEK